MRKITLWLAAVLCLLVFMLGNCSVFKPNADPVGHEYAISIQQEAMVLIAKAGESFSLHKEAVYRLMTRVERAYENARPRYKNKGVTGIWNVMRNPAANRLGRFMMEWEKEDILDKETIENAKKWLKEDFDVLIKLEESKE
ncbi:MAG: hypothetical protein GY950_28680 [bacterium]|nr:hypothetical protein [bacterium]